jgi:hypothetical protein
MLNNGLRSLVEATNKKLKEEEGITDADLDKGTAAENVPAKADIDENSPEFKKKVMDLKKFGMSDVQAKVKARASFLKK